MKAKVAQNKRRKQYYRNVQIALDGREFFAGLYEITIPDNPQPRYKATVIEDWPIKVYRASIKCTI